MLSHAARAHHLAFLAFVALASLAWVGSGLAQEVTLENPSFETDGLGVYGTSRPDAPVVGWRLFAGGGNSGLYEFEVMDEGSDGSQSLMVTRRGDLGVGAGGGVDLTGAEVDTGEAKYATVTFDARNGDGAEGVTDSGILVEVLFKDQRNAGRSQLKVDSLTDEFQTFTLAGAKLLAGNDGMNLVFRPTTPAGEAGPSSFILDNVRVVLHDTPKLPAPVEPE